MSAKRRFQGAVVEWLQGLLSRRSIRDVDVQSREVWVKHEGGGMVPKDSPLFMWSSAALRSEQGTEDWDRVTASAAKWPALAEHLGKMMSADGTGATRIDLEVIMTPFIPVPRWDGTAVQLPVFDPVGFCKIFERFENFIESDELVYLTKTLLVGLRMDESLLPCRFDDTLVIDKLSSEEVQAFGELGLIQRPFGHPVGLYEWTGLPTLVLCWERTLKKRLTDHVDLARQDYGAVRDEFDRVHEAVLQTLALSKLGVVGLGGGVTRIAHWDVGGLSLTRPTAEAQHILSPVMRSLEIGASEAAVMPSLFQKLAARTEEDALTIAIRRLTYAMENKRSEDRLLDDMIAAEALFGDEGEVAYRISLRFAFAVEPSDVERRVAVKKLMKDAYDVRSKLVHGARPNSNKVAIDGKPVPLERFVAEVENRVRVAVREALLQTNGKFSRDAWDERILRAEIPT